MRALIRFAGLRAEQEQRLRLAAGMLAAHGVEAQVAAWDGTRCDLVVANPEDAYGAKVQSLAQRRGTRWLPLVPVSGLAAREDTVGALARLLHGALLDTSGNKVAAPALAVQQASQCGLVLLAQDGPLAGRDLEATAGGRSVHLLRSSSRVLSLSLSDQVAARDRLCEPGWSLRPLSAEESPSRPFEFAGSLDAFLLQAALRQPGQLPEFPEQACRLEDWPDLGSSPDAIAALRVVRTLSAQACTPSALAESLALAPGYVSACLWAFAAAGLLRREGGAAPVPLARAPTGVMARLVAWFGLGRAG